MTRKTTETGMCLCKSWMLVAAATVAMTGTLANAQAERTYNVRHNFLFTPGGNVVPVVQGVTFAHAWVRETGRNIASYSPTAQWASWNPFGTDRMIFGNFVQNSGLFGVPVWTNQHVVIVPPAGGVTSTTATVPLGPSFATATGRVSFNPYGVNTPVTGSTQSTGTARAVGNGATAYAFSAATAQVRSRSMFPNGSMVWGPILRDTVSGSGIAVGQRAPFPGGGLAKDPIYFRLIDDLGSVALEEQLLSIESELFGDGELDWSDTGMFSMIGDGEVQVSMNNTFIINPSLMLFRVENSVVTQSMGTGLFAGVLPPLGSSGTSFSFMLPSELTLNYTLPAFNGDVEFDFGGAARGTIPVPGSAALIAIAGLVATRRHRASVSQVLPTA